MDRELKFDKYLKTVLSTAGKKLSALARLSGVLSFKKMRILLKSFVENQFGYCPLVWMLCSRTINSKINKFHERALRILYNDDVTSFKDLLEKDNSETIHHRNIKLLAKELFKVQNNISPNVLDEFLISRELNHNLRNKSIFLREKSSSTKYGTNSLRILGPKVWEIIPNEIRNAQSLECFENKMRNWKVQNCPCNLCKEYVEGIGFV